MTVSGRDPVEMLEEAFELYRDYMTLNDAATLGLIAAVDDEPEFYAPAAVPQGLFVH